MGPIKGPKSGNTLGNCVISSMFLQDKCGEVVLKDGELQMKDEELQTLRDDNAKSQAQVDQLNQAIRYNTHI